MRTTVAVLVALAAAPSACIAAGSDDRWETLGHFGGIYRLDVDRSGALPKGRARARFVVDVDGRLVGQVMTYDIDCARRTLRPLSSGDWAGDRAINERPATPAQSVAVGAASDEIANAVVNALCGVAEDTGKALASGSGWSALGSFDGRLLEIQRAGMTRTRAQFRSGSYQGGTFTGIGWIVEADCARYALRSVRDQVWTDGTLARDEATAANSWTSSARSEIARAIQRALCGDR